MTQDFLDGVRRFQAEADAAGYGREGNALSAAMGRIMVTALEAAYRNGFEDGFRSTITVADLTAALHLNVCGNAKDPAFDLFDNHEKVAQAMLEFLKNTAIRRTEERS